MSKRKITELPGVDFRAPTGPLRIGTDWPGTFIRADEAGTWTGAIEKAVQALKPLVIANQDIELDQTLRDLKKLQQLLKTARVEGAEYDRIARERFGS